jgi:hypothetical protein
LHGQLVEADDGALLVVGQTIQVQEILHPRRVLARDRVEQIEHAGASLDARPRGAAAECSFQRAEFVS